MLEQVRLPREVIDLFGVWGGKYYFDVVFCERPAVLPLFVGNLGFSRRERRYKYVVSNVHYAMDLDRHLQVTEETQRAYFSGVLASDLLLFACGDQCDIDSYSQLRAKSRKLFSSSDVKRLADTPRMVKQTSDIQELQDLSQRKVSTGEEFRVHYGFSKNLNFRFDEILSVIRQLAILRQGVKFVVTTPTDVAGVPKESWVEDHGRCDRRRFLEIALRSDVFVFWPIYRTGINHGSVVEMARLGVLPVFHNRNIPYPWCDTEEGYPFTFSTERELLNLLLYLREKIGSGEISELVKKNQKLLDQTYAAEGHAVLRERVIAGWKEKLVARKPEGVYDRLVKLIPNRVTMSELLDLVKRETATGVSFDRSTKVDRWTYNTKDWLRSWLLYHGWVDRGGTEEPLFEKGK